ncbi:peptidyl-dipeptidase Dcp [Strigomonas culicis]|uniref:oligopeptidase A n=1 Tax=Strigomonas culicis TaxID=28005 RepID=S9V910_9TRYP|nr:peptidyl-dipeptidase dcp [Strigomonas culicis]EPY24936.1 peptidyl-dipeptidase Dcp [Strigomonas culicis]|eukprot:EPY23466.1 peptidyl-dipeptidase dcp [Strigomonas culicis]
MTANPFFAPSALPFQAPCFDGIKVDHFAPAFDEGMAEQLEELTKLKRNPEPATFENTVVALEKTGQLFLRARHVFDNLCASNSTDEMQRLEEGYAAKFARHRDALFLDSELYARVHEVFNQRESLSGEDLRLVEYYEEEFTRAGAHLTEDKKSQLRDINERIAYLETAFGNKLLCLRKTCFFIADSAEELDGLSREEIEGARKEAETLGHNGKYAIPLVNTTQQPIMASLTIRDTRKKLFDLSVKRAQQKNENDTRALLEEMVHLRLRKAHLCGHKCFTDWKLQGQMADREAARALLQEMATASEEKAQEEAKEIRALMTSVGETHELEPWDWSFYAEKVRKQSYSVDEKELRQYFELHNVLEKGVFYVAEQLYGIKLRQTDKFPVYHNDVMVYEVFEEDGRPLALYYYDPFARANKQGGAWMSNFVEQSALLQQQPVVVNVTNFVKPPEGSPCLLSPWNVTTLFHEFGHGLHGMLSRLKYRSLSGTAVARDFLEFPSQVNEHWATYDPVLYNYGLHYKTGEPIPKDLVDKMKASDTFNAGFGTLEVVKAAIIDMHWHCATEAAALKDTDTMEREAMETFHLTSPLVPTRYHSSYFAHVFQGAYPSSYYVYQWARVLDCEGFEWFLANKGICRENGDHLRKTVLSVGNSVNANDAFVAFAGKRASMAAFFRKNGFRFVKK